MKNKWLILCLVFILGLLGSPVFALTPQDEGLYVVPTPQTGDMIYPQAMQLETVMETLLGTALFVLVYFSAYRLIEGPATNVPQRYDKARESQEKMA